MRAKNYLTDRFIPEHAFQSDYKRHGHLERYIPSLKSTSQIHIKTVSSLLPESTRSSRTNLEVLAGGHVPQRQVLALA